MGKRGETQVEFLPSIHRVIQYSGLNYYQVLELPCDLFQLMLKNSIVEELNHTEEGREYLAKCERLNATTLDEVALHKRFG